MKTFGIHLAQKAFSRKSIPLFALPSKRSSLSFSRDYCQIKSKLGHFIPTHGRQNNCKLVFLHAPQNLLGICAFTVPHAVTRPRRHSYYADHVSRQILTEGIPRGVHVLMEYRPALCQMTIYHQRHTSRQRYKYDPALCPIRTLHIPDVRIMRIRFCADACPFVRPCL